MPSPFHQKYSSQSHKVFGKDASTDMPEGPKDIDRRASDASIGSASSSTAERRRSSAASRFANLQALKRPEGEEQTNRRASLQDAKIGHPGMFGNLWNSFTRGPTTSQPVQQQHKEPRDTTTLRQ